MLIHKYKYEQNIFERNKCGSINAIRNDDAHSTAFHGGRSPTALATDRPMCAEMPLALLLPCVIFTFYKQSNTFIIVTKLSNLSKQNKIG